MELSGFIRPIGDLRPALALAGAMQPAVPIRGFGTSTVIDGLRWDYWLKHKDQEVTTFRGHQIVKEV